MEEEQMGGEEKKLVGKITHYYGKIGVAVVQVTDELNVGDEISIEGPVTNLRQRVESMQIEHEDIQKAKAGDDIGMKVADKVRENDNVYKITAA
jgi:putative protease